MAHVAETGLTQQMLDADIAQFRHLLADPRRGAKQTPTIQHERQSLGIAHARVGPGVQVDRVDPEIGGIMRLPDMHHVGSGVE